MHVADIDPNRPGLEIFTVHEGATGAPYGSAMRDAATGELIFGAYSGKDTGRGMIGDVRPDVAGMEVWSSMPGGTDASGLLSATGSNLSASTPGTNQSIRWSAQLTTQIVNGSGDSTPTIDDWAKGTVLTASGTRTNNGTKGTASLVADVFGDWREELVVRTADSSALRIYTNTDVAKHKLTTLMHDPQYRAEIARQNTTYNQPAYTSYYLASDMDFTKVPLLTKEVAPAAPKFVNAGKSPQGIVIAPNSGSVDYYVDEVKVKPGSTKVKKSTVTVTAVPKPYFSMAPDATFTWTHEFSK
jgi:hypothetical protein